MKKILEQNNIGVELLYDGQYEKAKDAFDIALDKLTVMLQRKESRNRLNNQEDNELVDLAEPFSLKICVVNLPKPVTSCTETFIYRNALKVYEAESQSISSSNTKNTTILTTVLAFNLGLMHHCNADTYGLAKNLISSLQLYEMAWNIIAKEPLMEHRYESLLGILNNMGAINYELDNYNQSKRCFQVLKNFCSIKSTRVPSAVLAGISSNVMLLLEEPTVAKAA